MKIKQSDNIVIVGSGVTGLCSGAILAKLGYKVIVLEMHPHLFGGHARTLEVAGVPFCAGPQFLWNFDDGSDSISHQIFKLIELDKSISFLSFNEDCQDC